MPTIRPHRLLRLGGTLGLIVGALLLAAAPVWGATTALALQQSASSTLVELDVADIPQAGVDGFSGGYGTAGTPDLSSDSDTVEGDFSDPEGVQDYVDVSGTELVETSWAKAPGQLTARANATGFDLGINGVPVASWGSIDSYARCLDNGGALAYARGDGSMAQVLGQNVPVDTPTEIDATGEQLGLSDNVATAKLTATVSQVENMVNDPDEVSAEAYVQLTIDAVFYDADGNVIYEGPFVDMKIGHVKVDCTPDNPPSESPTSTSGTNVPSTATESPTGESPTTSISPSESITPLTPSGRSPSLSPPPSTHIPSSSPSTTATTGTEVPSATGGTESPSTPTPSSSATPPISDDVTGGTEHPGPPTPQHPMPTTGGGVMPLAVTGLAVAMGGIIMLIFAKRLNH